MTCEPLELICLYVTSSSQGITNKNTKRRYEYQNEIYEENHDIISF